ncbi:MAG: CHAD domain-containing protein, partial [Motiliproteus sp.]|nr:CHAD domain-containing protein [Motiliproteus sp.]
VAESGEQFWLFEKGRLKLQGDDKIALPGLIMELPDSLSAQLQADEIRALLPQHPAKIGCRKMALLDDQKKTVARINHWQLSGNDKTLHWVEASPVRGYVKSFARLQEALAAIGLQSNATMPERLLPSLRLKVSLYSAKPDFKIADNEPAQHLARRLCSGMLSIARLNEPGTIKDLDSEFLHDYRVSLRRVRSVVALFSKVFNEQDSQRMKAELADLMRRTNRLRDLDVYLLEKESYFKLLPKHLHSGLEKMFRDFTRERGNQQRKTAKWLASDDYKQAILSVEKFFSQQPLSNAPNAATPALGLAKSSIWKRYRKVCAIAKEITPETPDEQVHDLRIQCKKLRYLMEFFSPLFPKKVIKKQIRALKGLQDNLGRFNDFSVQQESLHDYLKRKMERGNLDLDVADSIGALRLVLNQQQRQERDRVMACFARFHSPEIHQSFETCFDHKRNA